MSIFSYVCWSHIRLLLKSVSSCPSPTFEWLFIFLINLFQYFVDSVYQPFIRWIDCKNFFPFCWLPVHSNECLFCCAEALEFNQIPFVCFVFYCQCFWCFSHEVLAYTYVLMVLPRFSPRIFIVLGLKFKSVIHLELILV